MSQAMTDEDRRAIHEKFHRLVNMTPSMLRRWLASADSRSVGMTGTGEKVTSQKQPEAVGHHMGHRIIEIRGKKNASLDDDDYRDMRKVVGYIHRHLKQRPSGGIEDTRWRKSLMNWGHDPLQDRNL